MDPFPSDTDQPILLGQRPKFCRRLYFSRGFPRESRSVEGGDPDRFLRYNVSLATYQVQSTASSLILSVDHIRHSNFHDRWRTWCRNVRGRPWRTPEPFAEEHDPHDEKPEPMKPTLTILPIQSDDDHGSQKRIRAHLPGGDLSSITPVSIFSREENLELIFPFLGS